jgi:hypothetical protein
MIIEKTNIINILKDIGFCLAENRYYIFKYKNYNYTIRIQYRDDGTFNRYVLNRICFNDNDKGYIIILNKDKDLISKLNTIFVEYFRKIKINKLLNE